MAGSPFDLDPKGEIPSAGTSFPIAAPGESSSGPSRKRILYIEDDPGVANLVRRILERGGYQVDLAHDGGEGLPLLATETHDALIIDQNLPGHSGLDLIRTLREAGRLPPTVMLTGAGNEAVAVDAMKLGVNDYITKDVTGVYLDLLPSVIEKAVQQRSVLVAKARAEASLEQERAQLLSVFESLEEAIYVSDIDTYEILFVNAAMRRLMPDRLLIGETCYRALQDLDSLCSFCTNPIISENPGQVHRWEHHSKRIDRDFDMTDRLIRWPDGRMVRFEYARDITDRKRAEERLEHLAYHDILTGLPNRQLLRDRLDTALALAERRGRHMGLIFIDIDRFKSVNDTYGHQAGDSLLQSLSKRLRETVRRSDTVGRIGGDEFLVLVPEVTHAKDVALIAEKIVRVMRLPFHEGGREVIGTCSAGTVVYPEDGNTADELLSKADEALYRAKALGGSRHQAYRSHYGIVEGQTASRRKSLALAIETDQLVLHYQPQVSLHTGAIVGVEALVRWQHPDRGLLAPSEFLPFAQSVDLSPAVDRWVLRRACEQAGVWRDAGMPRIRISVNLSLGLLRTPNLSSEIQAILTATCLEPETLDLELTESLAAEDIGSFAGQLEALRLLGVRLSLDDFGVGSTSIGHLHRLPIGCVKIDQSLIHAAAAGPRQANVVSAICAFAHTLDLVVVAEGVETDEQADLARRCACDIGQGFVFARPMPANLIDRYLATEWQRAGRSDRWKDGDVAGRAAA